MAFGGLPRQVRCPLHIFEPRYRLMMRRCIDSGRREFGMVAHPDLRFGTMLNIENFVQLPDGRSSLETVGARVAQDVPHRLVARATPGYAQAVRAARLAVLDAW